MAAITPFLMALLACSGMFDDMKAQGDAAKAEGAAYAVGRDQTACIDEALSRAMTQPELQLVFHATNGVWLESCIGAASPVAGLCDGVPTRGEIMPTVEWRVRMCDAHGYTDTGDQRCHRLMDAIQRHCHPES